MQLLDHVSISVRCLASCIDFYDAVMQALGCEKVYQTATSLGYGEPRNADGVRRARKGTPALLFTNQPMPTRMMPDTGALRRYREKR